MGKRGFGQFAGLAGTGAPVSEGGAAAGDFPDAALHVDLGPERAADLPRPRGGMYQELQREADRGRCPGGLQRLQRPENLSMGQRLKVCLDCGHAGQGAVDGVAGDIGWCRHSREPRTIAGRP